MRLFIRTGTTVVPHGNGDMAASETIREVRRLSEYLVAYGLTLVVQDVHWKQGQPSYPHGMTQDPVFGDDHVWAELRFEDV